MLRQTVKVLLIEDNILDARLVKEYLLGSSYHTFIITHVTSLSEAFKTIFVETFDVVLLDLGLPDSQGTETLKTMLYTACIPIVVLTGYDDSDNAIYSIQKGAQDYLIKGELNASLLIRTILHALERHKLRLLLEEASEAVRESEINLRNVIYTSPDGVVVINTNGITRFVNPTMEKIVGVKKEALVGRPFEYWDLIKRCVPNEISEREIETLDGRSIFVEFSYTPIKWSEEEAYRVNFRDITLRIKAEHRMRLAAMVMESTHEAIFITDLNHQLIEVNPALCKITEYRAHELIGKDLEFMTAGDYELEKLRSAFRDVKEKGFFEGEIWFRRKGGDVYASWLAITTIKDQKEQPKNYVGIFTDITQRKLIEENLQKMAHYDVLTGLPNRALFNDRLENAIAEAKRDSTQLALLFIDLDGFKPINDKLGHDTGDLLLGAVADRLKQCIRASDTVARLGGDEFAAILRKVGDEADVATVAKKILHVIDSKFYIKGHTCSVGASIGIALYPKDATEAEDLLKKADMAMYNVKHSGKNNYGFWRCEQ